MTELVIWLIAFAVILFFSLKRWETAVSPGLNKVLPRTLKHDDDNSWVWSLALAILGATTLVRPVDILLVAILIGILVLVGRKLAGWAMNKADF